MASVASALPAAIRIDARRRRLLASGLAAVGIAGVTAVTAVTVLVGERNLGMVSVALALLLLGTGVLRASLPVWWWGAASAATLVLAADMALDSTGAVFAAVLPCFVCFQLLVAAEARERRALVRGIVVVVAVLAAVAGVSAIGRNAEIGPLLLLVAAVVAAAAVHRRPFRPPLLRAGASAAVAARLLHGRTHISSFAASADKQTIALPCGSVIGTRVCMGVAVTAGDPLAGPDRKREAIREFVALFTVQGWRPCFFQTDPQLRSAYRGAGLRLVKFGEEAIVDLRSFSLDTPQRANLRREVGRAQRAGLSAAVLPWSALTPVLAEELRDLSGRWLQGRGAEMGFSVGRVDETIDAAAWLTLVRDAGGAIVAFSSWLRTGENGIALDLMRRRPDAAPGAVDLCLVATLAEAQQRGVAWASLGSVPCRDSLHDAPDGRVAGWLRSRLYRRGFGGYHYRSLAAFKQKFAPTWVSRDIAYARGDALRVGLALAQVHRARGADRGSRWGGAAAALRLR